MPELNFLPFRSKQKITLSILFVLLSLFVPLSLLDAQDVPAPQGRVNDFAGVISQEYKEKIAALISELEVATSAEIAVVTQKSIAPYDEFQYAQMIFDQWGIGQKGKDNGVLVLVAVEERAWRIHTGYGMEGVLPDSVCTRIGREDMVPYLKNNDYSQGLYAGVAGIARAVSMDAGISLSTLKGVQLTPPENKEEISWIAAIFMFLFFLVWNFPWPIFIGLPFTLLFGTAMARSSPVLALVIAAAYLGSMGLRCWYWTKQPALTRGPLWKVLIFGMLTKGMSGSSGGRSGSGGGWSSGGGSSGGGSFGGGRSGGGGSGGRF